MATIKELLNAMIDKINGNEDKIDNIKGVPDAFDSITMTNGTDVANLTMSAEKELLLDGEAVGGGLQIVTVDMETMTASHSASEIIAMMQTAPVFAYIDGSYVLLIKLNRTMVLGSMIMGSPVEVMVISYLIAEDKSVEVSQITIEKEIQ